MEKAHGQNGKPAEDGATEASNPTTGLAQPQENHEAIVEEQDREHLTEMLQRVQADFVNYRRRSEEEREEQQKYANSRLILKFLPVVDQFNLAIEHAANSEAESSWLEGIRLVQRNIHALLESESVTKLDVDGKEFDPFEHEAIGFQESSEHHEGQIVSVAREGYKLRDRIIRPALVIVARTPEADRTEPAVSESSCSSERETENA